PSFDCAWLYLSLNCASEDLSSPSCGATEICLPGFAACFLRLIKRAASVGVSVNETRSETAIANDDVNPNEDMKRPTMPAMKPTGRKTASSDSVVAVTAKPISRVP